VTHNTLTRGHVAFDTSGLFWKIPVCLKSPYLQQIAVVRKMHANAVAYRTSIRRFKRANYQLIDQFNYVPNVFLKWEKNVPGTGLPSHCENTQQVD
jgi:hypothetical protein